MNSSTILIFYIIGALVCSLTVESQKIRGTPGIDYPSYPEIPKTSFRCSEQEYIPGFYADLETQCQVFHFCYENRQESFLCPTGTIFNQKILGCDAWYSSNCSLAPQFYNVNAGPAIEKAGKGISMLLKVKDQSRSNAQASTSDVLQKISSLFEGTTELPMLDSNVDNAVSEEERNKASAEAVDKQKSETTHEENIVEHKGSANVSEVLGNLIADLEKIKNGEKSEDKGYYSDMSMDSDNDIDKPAEFYSELTNKGFIYDPVSGQYYLKDYDPLEWDLEDDSESMKEDLESMNEEYRNYYNDFEDILLHGENEPVNIFGNVVDDQVNEEGIEAREQKKRIPESADLNYQNPFGLDEFSKRILETEETSRRTRRKPVYVMLDDTDPNSSGPQQSLNVFLPQTESSYFTESISLDDLFSESSTKVPSQQESEEDLTVSDLFRDVSSEEEKSIEEINAESPDLNPSKPSEKFRVPSISELESQVLDFPQQEEPEVETTDFVPFENERLPYSMEESMGEADEAFPGEQQAEYSVNVLRDEPEMGMSYYEDPLEYLTHEESEDIRIVPDLSEKYPEGLIDGTELDQRLIYNSDSVNYEVSEDEESEDVGYNPVQLPQNEDWAYMYGDSPEYSLNHDSYESMLAGAQDYESEETSNYDPYDEYMGQSYVPDSPESVDSQYLPPEYRFAETEEQYSPQDYRLIMGNEKNFQTYEVDETSYQAGVETGSEYSPFDLPVEEDLEGNVYYPEDARLEESGPESYRYRYVQPNNQQIISTNDYPYSQQFSYIYDDLKEIQYPYENYFEDESEVASFQDLAESAENENFESFDLESTEEPEMDEYPSELEPEKENFETDTRDESSEDAGGEDLRVDYIEDESIREPDFDDFDRSEEIFYVFDEDSGTLAVADEPSYESLNMGQEEPLDSNYPEIDEYNDLLSETEYHNLKPTQSERATDSLKLSGSANESGSDDQSAPDTLPVTSEDKKEDFFDSFVTADDSSIFGDVYQSKNSKPETGGWSSHTFEKESEKQTPFSTVQEHRLTDFKPETEQPFERDFMASSEIFMNNMAFPNAMDFDPYGYGDSNIGQFRMMDSSNTAAFTKKDGEISDKENAEQTRLKKLSSLKDKVLSMKRGKFGMFKKSIKNLK